MDTETLTERIERLKLKAKSFLKENINAFIKDIYNNYHFCNIILIKEYWILVKHFKGSRKGEEIRLFWSDIIEISEYIERGALNSDGK